MQNSILNSIRSLKLVDGCKGSSQVYALNPTAVGTSDKAHHHGGSGGGGGHHSRQGSGALPGCGGGSRHHVRSSSSFRSSGQCQAAVSPDSLLPYGLPSPDLIDPPINPFPRSIDPVQDLAASFRRLSAAGDLERCDVHLEQRSLLHFLNDPKLLRRSLRSARIHAPDLHHKIVLSAWLRYERREYELDYPESPSSAISISCNGPSIECPKAALVPGYNPEIASDPCPCRRQRFEESVSLAPESPQSPFPLSSPYAAAVAPGNDDAYAVFSGEGDVDFEDDEEGENNGEREQDEDVVFCIGDDEIPCYRYRIASLSMPFRTMLYGGFAESRRGVINFSHNGVSATGMRAIDAFSRTGRLHEELQPDIVLELLTFSNKFCCEGMKAACDAWLASLVRGLEEALLLVDYGLEENAHLLVASCLQVFLRELPRSLHIPQVTRHLCSPDGRERLASSGHASFALYYLLSQAAMEEDMRSNTTVMLLERLSECAEPGWQKQLALHQLGCVMLERDEYEDAQKWFEEAVKAGHMYSVAGVARAKYRRGNRYAAFKLINSLICDYDLVGWMYQERSLYGITREEKLRDLDEATRLDPTLCYPYKYRAIILMEDNKIGAAIAEINKILGFKVTTDCLELRAWLSMAQEDYEGALRDIRALMTMDPDYMMFHGRVHGDQLIEVLQDQAQQWSLADCWMQLYDRWSSVDDIGSLSVVHQMLANDPCKSILRFRQSLLLLRLNSQKAAMCSLRLARNLSLYEHERLVYEGWILYDTGHREEALAKAEESISIQRSFEAFFLKAYALADTTMDMSASNYVIHLLEEALRCPSDGLRKGQALNNLGSVYVDCDKLDLAADCYVNALNIRHTRAHQGLARVYHLKNQRKAAYDEMTKLIEKARNNASAYEKRSEYCDRDMAKSDLLMATQLDPLRTYPYRYRAAVLMDDHKEDEAIVELTKALAFKPDLQLLHLRAAFFDSIGDGAATLRDCEAALCLDPNHSDTLELYQKASERVAQEQK